MEGVEFDAGFPAPEPSRDVPDFCESILARFENTPDENSRSLCVVIGAMSQEITDQNLPRTPVAYFGAACSSLDRLLSSSTPDYQVASSLLISLSFLLPSVSAALLNKKLEFLSDILIKALQCDSLSIIGVVSGLKCASHLMITGGDGNWETGSQMYGVLLRYTTDSRQKVRRQSHLSLHDVLQNLCGTLSLAPVSQGITAMFQKFLLLAGGSKADVPDVPGGAQEVLHVLDALKECLPHMLLACTNSVLKNFKTLLELRKPIVTRRVTDILSVICLYPTSQVSPEGLLDLLCFLAHSVSFEETTVDAMTFTARLLDSGSKKVHSLNRQACVIKLPVMVNSLRDIMGSEHEEAIFAATEAFKSIINDCIDDKLVKQGVDQMRMNADMGGRSHSSYLMRGILKSLADLQRLPDEDFPYRRQLHECVGSALVAMGVETFLSLLPLNLEADDVSEVNVWLFPILKQHTVGAYLNYFRDSVFDTIRLIRQNAWKLELEGHIYSSRNADAIIYSLWSLLPSFCNYAKNTAEVFEDLKTVLCNTMDEEPDLRVIICSSLQLLIEQNKKVLDGIDPEHGLFCELIKILLEMLIKKCGVDAVRAVMPEEHMKLLTNVRKIKERREVKKSSNPEESRSLHSKATTSRLSRWNHTKIFSDSDEEEENDSNGTDCMDAETITGRWRKASSVLKLNVHASSKSKRLRKVAKSLPEDLIDQLEDEPLDLLDRGKTRSSLKSTSQLKRKANSDEEMAIDLEGRLVIHDGEDRPRKKASSPSPPFSDMNSEAALSHRSTGSSRKGQQKKRKTSETGWAYTGSVYVSKKAKGDLKRKDKLEPYAYWPLDRKMMSRRPEHRARATRGMASVVKMTKMLEGKTASGVLKSSRMEAEFQ